MVLDSDSDDGQSDSENELLLDDWDECMTIPFHMYMTCVSNCGFLFYKLHDS